MTNSLKLSNENGLLLEIFPQNTNAMNQKTNLLKNLILALLLMQIFILKASAQTLTNGSFETPVVGAINLPASYRVAPTGAGVNCAFIGISGIAANGSQYSSSSFPTYFGKQYAFLDGSSGAGATFMIAFTVTAAQFAQGNNYSISFYASQAAGNTTPQSVAVGIGNSTLGNPNQ